jgi:hypothetical protein
MPYTRENRFRNTLKDLLDCRDHLDDGPLSEDEELARRELVQVCTEVAASPGQPYAHRHRPGVAPDRG